MRTLLFCLAIVVLSGCSSGGSEEEGSSVNAVAPVRLARAEPGDVAETITLFGAAENGGAGRYALSAPVESVVVSIDAPVGTAVQGGQLIVRLSPSPSARLDLARASADARAAQAAYARARRLRADGLVSNADVETTRAAAQSAAATLASLSVRGRSLALRAPGAGFVESVAITPGDVLASGAAVASIARRGDLRARFGVDPSVARRLRPGLALRIMPAGGGAPFTTRILSVDPGADPQTRLASVFAQIPAAARIGPGEALQAEVTAASMAAAVVIPYAALLDDGGQPYVYVVTRGIAHRRNVVIGPSDGRNVPIIQGVRPGELVVTEGGTGVEDGIRVRPS